MVSKSDERSQRIDEMGFAQQLEPILHYRPIRTPPMVMLASVITRGLMSTQIALSDTEAVPLYSVAVSELGAVVSGCFFGRPRFLPMEGDVAACSF